MTLKDVQEELGREEAEERRRGVISLHETTASVFISMGLDLEEQQYVIPRLVATFRALILTCRQVHSQRACVDGRENGSRTNASCNETQHTGSSNRILA